jgi:hypothetical protein
LGNLKGRNHSEDLNADIRKGWEGMDWIILAYLLNTGINLWVPQLAGNFLTA